MTLLTVFAKKEKSTEPLDKLLGFSNKLDTVIYKDKECTQFFGRFPWYFIKNPRRNSKLITLDCCNWNLV
ncbi:hypothetical protein AAKU61_004230 [Undibacterium sp. GrIS 1.2]